MQRSIFVFEGSTVITAKDVSIVPDLLNVTVEVPTNLGKSVVSVSGATA